MNFIPMLSNLQYRRLTTNALCPICADAVESREHIFRECSVTKQFWQELNCKWPNLIEDMDFLSWDTWLFENNS